MSSDAEILTQINRAFGTCLRPEHFTNYTHCEECLDHDEVLRSRDLETLGLADVGGGGWDPICFISAEGYAYYFPAFARLALSAPDAEGEWYGPQFLSHLIYNAENMYDVERNSRYEKFTPEQRMAVVELLKHMLETRAELLDNYMSADRWLTAFEIWSAPDAA